MLKILLDGTQKNEVVSKVTESLCLLLLQILLRFHLREEYDIPN